MPRADHKADKGNEKEMSLKEICFKAVGKHFASLGTEAVADLPAPLIKELFPHLTVCQLDELQPALNLKGISTHSAWVGILQGIRGRNHVVDLHTEEEAKNDVMRRLFTVVFYSVTNSFANIITDLKTSSFLRAAAKCINHFPLSTNLPLQNLTTEPQPLLNLLEKRIRSVSISPSLDLWKKNTQNALYVFHRLIDHGAAKELIVHTQSSIMLAWLLHARGSQYVNSKLKNLVFPENTSSAGGATCSSSRDTKTSDDREDQVPPCKRPKLESVSEGESGKADLTGKPLLLCRGLDGVSGSACSFGQIERLEIRQCSSDILKVLISSLPTFFCLRSLTLHSNLTFNGTDMLDLARALKQLSESPRSSLTELTVSVLPHTELVDTLLEASPNLTSLCVELLTGHWTPVHIQHRRPSAASGLPAELPLQKLEVKAAKVEADVDFLTSVLRRCPHLTSLHVAGMRVYPCSSQGQLLTTVSESNPCLTSLHLEDLSLSDCLPEILNLLRDCKLEELHFNDCRLLEKWNDKQEGLQRLVAALKTVPSLHTLSMAQNRLAKNVCVLAELFSGSSPSPVKRLDISSNFIQPADLLEFSKAFVKHRPHRQLILDLRRNPADRDHVTWSTALTRLRPFCVLLVERWEYTHRMADHISNM